MVAAELKYLAAEQAGGGGGFERVDKVTGGLGKRAWEHLTFYKGCSDLFHVIFVYFHQHGSSETMDHIITLLLFSIYIIIL